MFAFDDITAQYSAILIPVLIILLAIVLLVLLVVTLRFRALSHAEQ